MMRISNSVGLRRDSDLWHGINRQAWQLPNFWPSLYQVLQGKNTTELFNLLNRMYVQSFEEL